MKPGTEPVRALVDPFFRTWQFDAADPARAKLQARWTDDLLDGAVSLRDIFDATELRYREELRQPAPPAFLLYVDQGEELYVRAEPRQRRRFSEILAEGLGDPRLRAMMSLRADFFGELLNDEPLQEVSQKIEVPPLARGATARSGEPSDRSFLVPNSKTITSRAISPGAPPSNPRQTPARCRCCLICSMTCGSTWSSAATACCACLRHAIELGGVLVDRANGFLTGHPEF